jgi:hypothetical protein
MAYESSKSSTKHQTAKPGASTKSTAKLAASSGDTRSGMPTKSGSEVAAQECDAIEADLAALKVTYEQYFLGMERTPPTRTYEELKKRVERLKNSFVRNTGAKFRVAAVAAKFVSYERLWQRTLLEIENGTYKRDMFKAKRKSQKAPDKARSSQNNVVDLTEDANFDVDEVDSMLSSTLKSPVPSVAPVPPVPSVEPVPFRGGVPSVAPLVPSVAPLVPPVAPVSGTPARGTGLPSIAPLVPSVAPAIAPVAARPAGTGPRPAMPVRPPTAGSASDLSDDKLKTVYDAYVAAKRRNKEDTSKMSYDSIAASLRKQVPELMKQHGAKAVEFKVVIKDGKAVLKAVPK